MGADDLLDRLVGSPIWPLKLNTLVSGAIALRVELFKLYHAPLLDAFRLTLPGKLPRPRVFAMGSVAYAVAIVAGVLADRAMQSNVSLVCAADTLSANR